MNILLFLIAFPFLVAMLALVLPKGQFTRVVGLGANVVLCVATIYLLLSTIDAEPAYYSLESHAINLVMLTAEVGIAIYILYLSLRARKYLSAILVVASSLTMVSFELMYGHAMHIEHGLFIDQFSTIMAVIIGCIGSAICLYAFGYIPEYHEHHPEVKDRRRYFAFLMYLFLSAMFGIVFSNNLMWVYFFWEITTVCSFLLIGYRDDAASRESAFRALVMNLLGGLVFAIGLVYLYRTSQIMELDKVLQLDQYIVLFPAVCIVFAGLVKSAQFPFSSWLTGAMVAPTPVSALLHSSTMVKAGVYIILRFAPVLENTAAAKMLTLIGGVSFLLTALIAISQSNAKKVLAYSTISNLGLIVACAGVNKEAALWSALLLIVFHAVAKSLLFLCVGIVEYTLGSRDIEDMDYLMVRMPKLAAVMMIGMAGMVIAPFGMVIAKVATLKAFVIDNPGMAIAVAYGSAATVFFWTKWMGKIISIKHGGAVVSEEQRVSFWENLVLAILAAATVAVCIAFPFIAFRIVDPYVMGVFGKTAVLDTFNVYAILIMMLGLWIVLPLGLLYYGYRDRGFKQVGTYLGGGNLDRVTFEGAMAATQAIEIRHYYLEKYFGENVLFNAGVFAAITFLLIMFGVVIQ